MAKLIGTAGHVDHGKTTLIRALTGIDADRLPEEKRRGMTIDIGFAHMDLPGVGRVSIVDVPGHEKFITNMLVGALGIDVALLCVAADESVMPQTREHLQILELLPVDNLVVAMTRVDLADEETRAMARLEIEELIASSRFGTAPIIEVSALTGVGLVELRSELTRALTAPHPNSQHPSPDTRPWYLPIDRVFPVKGHGCVVTGTLAQGEVKVGDKAVIMPGGVEVRVRALHSHGEARETGEKGRRTAINLSGVKVEQVHRGQSVGAPGALFATRMLDARVRWVGERRHGMRVRVSVGAEEAIGKVFLSDPEPEVVQVRLESEIASALNQPIIVRRYSPPDLLAGGRIVVPQAKMRRKSEAAAAISGAGGDEEAILQVLGSNEHGVATDEICRALGKTPQSLGGAFEQLSKNGSVKGFAGLWIGAEAFSNARGRFIDALDRLHQEHPAAAAIPRDRVVAEAGLRWAGKPLDRIIASLVAEGLIRADGTAVRDPRFRVSLSPKQAEFLSRVRFELDRHDVSTPSPQEIATSLHVPVQAVDEILRLGLEAGQIVRVGDGIFYTTGGIEGIKARIRQISGGKPFSAAQMRDALGTTRKYVIPLLEHLDSARFTLRVGDNRVVRSG